MNNRRAFTMIELTITTALTAIVIGAVAMMYSFTAVRLSDAYTQSVVMDQAIDVADRIEATIRNADSCTVKDSGATLMCSMPKNGVDSTGDGHYDTYYPDKVDPNNEAQYTVGRYYWFFDSNSGNYISASSGYIWRADSTSNTTPKKNEDDLDFFYYPGAAQKMRHPLVYSATFSVNAPASSVTFTVTAGSRMGSENTETSDLNASRVYSITRTVQWRD